MRHVTDAQRRIRLARRHALAPAARAADPVAATRALTVLHSTEPASVYLSTWARVPGVAVADIDDALYRERSLVKQLAMRRTLFVAPPDLLPALLASASARVAATERTKIAKDLVALGVADDGEAWLDRVGADVLAALSAAPAGLTAAELRETVSSFATRADGWVPGRVLVELGARGAIYRGANSGHWRASRPRWTTPERWLGAVPEPMADARSGYRELVRRWLYSFGPGTEDDLAWWLGGTKAAVRAALADVGAVAVSLDGGATGWLRPDDLEDLDDPGSWVALLPVLDPTVMGWRARDFYLGPHHPHIFDTRGNAGTTAWADGRIVGCWVQDDAGRVRVHLAEELPGSTRRALDDEADRLTAWLDGVRIGTVYPSAAMRTALAAGP